MAKILFINPVVREEDKPKHIPYGIAMLAAIAIDKNHQVQVYDANAHRLGYDIVADVVNADDWDVIAIGGLTTTYGSIKKTVKIIKEAKPDVMIMAGGGFMTSMPLDIMSWLPEIDLGIIGEAVITFPEVLEMIDQKNFDFSSTKGVCYRDSDGNPKLTQVREILKNIDLLPYPAWDLFPLDIYFENSQLLFSEASYYAKKRIDINGSYGCSLLCKFCWHLGSIGDMVIAEDHTGKQDVQFTYGRINRYHSPKYIVDMVVDLKQRFDIDFVTFLDENLMTMDAASRRTWLAEICDLWIEAGLQPTSRRDGKSDEFNEGGVFWSGTSHANLHTPEVLKKMYEAGCSHLVYGIESFDPAVLKNLGKGTSQRRNMEAVDTCLDSGISPIPNLIIGFPEDTFEGIKITMEAMQELGIHAKPHFATPYPGSEWYNTYKDSILKQYDGDLEAYILDLGDATKPTVSISHNFSQLELIGLQEIMGTRNFRLLELAREHWERTRKTGDEYAFVQPSPHFTQIKSKEKAPSVSLAAL
ncbi:MAG: radical SAM protein [Leptospiraceae bacterium]